MSHRFSATDHGLGPKGDAVKWTCDLCGCDCYLWDGSEPDPDGMVEVGGYGLPEEQASCGDLVARRVMES